MHEMRMRAQEYHACPTCKRPACAHCQNRACISPMLSGAWSPIRHRLSALMSPLSYVHDQRGCSGRPARPAVCRAASGACARARRASNHSGSSTHSAGPVPQRATHRHCPRASRTSAAPGPRAPQCSAAVRPSWSAGSSPPEPAAPTGRRPGMRQCRARCGRL